MGHSGAFLLRVLVFPAALVAMAPGGPACLGAEAWVDEPPLYPLGVLEELTPATHAQHRQHVRRLVEMHGGPRLQALIDMIKDRRFYYLPRYELVALGSPAIEPLRLVVSDPMLKEPIRLEALRALTAIGDERAFSFAERSLGRTARGRQPTEFSELWAGEILATMSEDARLTKLLELFESHQTARVATIYLIRLGRVCVPAMLDALQDRSRDEYIRMEALWVLRELHDPRAVPALIDVLSDTMESFKLRYFIILSFKMFEHPAIIPTLEWFIATWIPDPGAGLYDLGKAAQDTLDQIPLGPEP